MDYIIEYVGNEDRLLKVREQEALGRTMLHDDFTPTGGVMTFIDPMPKSPEELADEIEAEALAKADQLIDAITNLAGAKTFLKRLCTRLIKKGLLP